MDADLAATGGPAPVPDPDQLRAAMATFATGVTVVTVGAAGEAGTGGGDGGHGMTANAFTSVSLTPPLVLVCVKREARMHQLLARTDTFAVSVLAADQQGIARYFSRRERPSGMAQFEAVRWSPGRRTGAPLIDGAVAWFECTRWAVYDGGDHSIVVGRLVSVIRGDADEPLVFHHGGLRQLTSGGAPS